MVVGNWYVAVVACGEEGVVVRVKGGTEEVGRSPIVGEASMIPVLGSNLVLRSCLL